MIYNSKSNLAYIYIYIYIFSCIILDYQILHIVLYAIQQELVAYPFNIRDTSIVTTADILSRG